MPGRWLLILWLLWAGIASAAEVVDAIGRTVQVPDHVARVLPAGPPAAVLLSAIAPDLMLGWPSPVSDSAGAMLAPSAALLPQIPRLTGGEDVTAKLQALRPDLILDYGTVSPRYADLARTTQEKTGVPTILRDGSLTEIHTLSGCSGASCIGRVARRRWRRSPKPCWRCRRHRLSTLACSTRAARTD